MQTSTELEPVFILYQDFESTSQNFAPIYNRNLKRFKNQF